MAPALAEDCRVVNGQVVCDPVVHSTPKNVVHDDNVILQKRVEFDSDYFLGSDGYYGVAEGLQESQGVIDAQNQQILELLAIIDKLVDKIGNSPAPTPEPDHTDESDTPDTTDMPDDTDDPNIPDEPTDLEATLLDQKVYTIFNKNCASCHSETPKAGLKLVGTENGVDYLEYLRLEDRVKVYDHVAGIRLQERGLKLMPLGGPPLSDDEVATIWLWTVEEADRIKQKWRE